MTESVTRKPHRRFRAFYYAAVTGVVVFGLSMFLVRSHAISLGSIAFFLVYLGMSLRHLHKLTAKFLRGHAAETDAPVAAIFAATVVVIGVAVFSLFQLINAGGARNPTQLILAVLAVVLGWFMVHFMAAYHYAYEYYDVPDTDADTRPSGSVVGGLDFPSGKQPDGISFLYFSYVIGMTAQVADVSITSVHMQRLVMIHGIFSFFFNTVIIAATVNLAVSLGS